MDRVLAMLSKFHISAALVLATVAFLAVPEGVFADSGNCDKDCTKMCKDDADPVACHAACMADCESYVPCQNEPDGSGCVTVGAQCWYFGKASSCTNIPIGGGNFACNCAPI